MYEYRGRMNRIRRGISFSGREIWDLTKSLLTIGIAFAVVQFGFSLSLDFFVMLFVSILTAGMAFLLHELMHKVVATRYGCWSEFHSDNNMLILTLIISFLGVLFAAPGAVFINGTLTKREYGKVSASGPLTNLVLAVLFGIGYLLLPGEGILRLIAQIGMGINAWIGLFNMIPLWQFDGLKIWNWNRAVYVGMVLAAIGLTIGSSLI